MIAWWHHLPMHTTKLPTPNDHKHNHQTQHLWIHSYLSFNFVLPFFSLFVLCASLLFFFACTSILFLFCASVLFCSCCALWLCTVRMGTLTMTTMTKPRLPSTTSMMMKTNDKRNDDAMQKKKMEDKEGQERGWSWLPPLFLRLRLDILHTLSMMT